MVRQGMNFCLFACGFTLTLALPTTSNGASFRWKTGQVLVYKVEQVTSATDTVADKKSVTTTKLNLTKRWEIKDVDTKGVATLHLSLSRLRIENTPPDGDPLLYDSANPDKSDPDMAKQMAGYLGKTLAILRMDQQGKIVEVKESKFGPASRFQNELPFVITLPDAEIKDGATWERAYSMTLDPPQGIGEKYDAVQSYSSKLEAGNKATIMLKTALKTQPDNVQDRLPLLQLQPEGDIVFDTRLGLMRSAQLTIDKELKNHQGEGTSYRFQSKYSEVYAGDK